MGSWGDGPQPEPTEEEEKVSREPSKEFELDPKGEEPGHSSDSK